MFLLFCLVIALLPFARGLLQFEVIGITLDLYVFGILLLLPFTVWKLIRHSHLFKFRPVDIMIVVLGLSYLQSTLFSDDILQSGRIAFHALFIPAVTYFVVKGFVTTEKRYNVAFFTFLVSLALFSLATIIVFINTGVRPVVFNIPPIGAATLVVTLLITLLYSNTVPVILRVLGVPVTALALGATFSRVYLLLAIISPLFYKVTRSRKMLIMWIGMFAVTLILTFAAAYLSDIGNQNVGDSGERSRIERVLEAKYWLQAISNRTSNYRKSLDNFFQSPIFGDGIQRGDITVTPHNFNVEWLEYGGIIGYLVYLFVFLSFLASVKRAVLTDRQIAINVTILLVIILNSLTNGFMHGMMPYVAYLLMGFTDARLNILARRDNLT